MSKTPSTRESDQGIRLNRFIASSGRCTRKEADDLIRSGVVFVNGKKVTAMGVRIDSRKDQVICDGAVIRGSSGIYRLLNKGKGIPCHPLKRGLDIYGILNLSPSKHIHVLDALPPDWTGLVLATDDKSMVKADGVRLKHEAVYHVLLEGLSAEDAVDRLNSLVSERDDLDSLKELVVTERGGLGIALSDGSPGLLKQLISGLKDKVRQVDRVMYAGLSKKDLPRGRWRPVDERELGFIHMGKQG